MPGSFNLGLLQSRKTSGPSPIARASSTPSPAQSDKAFWVQPQPMPVQWCAGPCDLGLDQSRKTSGPFPLACVSSMPSSAQSDEALWAQKSKSSMQPQSVAVQLVCCKMVKHLVHPRSWSAFANHRTSGSSPVAHASSTPSPRAKCHKPLGPQQVNLDCIHNPWLFRDAPDHVTLVCLKVVRRLVHPQLRAQAQLQSLFAGATSVCITVVQLLSLVA